MTLSGFELASLELQRFWRLLKVHAIELHAKFLVGVCAFTHGPRSRAPQPGTASGTQQLEPSQRVTASASALFRQSQFSNAT